MWYQIEIKNGTKSTYEWKEELKRDGFSYKKVGKYTGKWQKKLEDVQDTELISNYYRKKGLEVICFSENEQRSSGYREQYLNVHFPNIGNYYFCSYCSKLLKKEQVNVDHIIPVAKAKKSKFWRFIIRILQLESINDPKNLTISCSKCNRKKSTKTGLWIIKGLLGQCLSYWIFIYFFIAVVICMFINYFI